ncbi:protein trichome birefringence-like 19 [Curcuma longa]|uniref:protein trichome birefringence-like 19 n=1 Tax=Curcuma longa TaxID=136217 RepID=UPI003D9E2B85
MKPRAMARLLTARSYLKPFHNLLSVFVLLLSLLAIVHLSSRHFLFQFAFYSSSTIPPSSPSPSPSPSPSHSLLLSQTPSPSSSPSPCPSPSSSSPPANSSPPSSAINATDTGAITYTAEKDCDIFRGEWVREDSAGDYYYTNASCGMIQEHQNCAKYGRPDAEFLRWRWRPDGCELPRFDPRWFLELVRGTAVAFVGDSLARNQMQSLLCLLSTVAYPEEIASTGDRENRQLLYGDYNFTVAIFWTPFLVKGHADAGAGGGGYTNIFLDEVDAWAGPHLAAFDYLILSSGTWWTRPSVYFKNSKPFARCNYCWSPATASLPRLTLYEANRAAFRSALDSLRWYQGAVFLRTFSPSHFEGGPWNAGGHCVRSQPEARWRMERMELEMYRAQVEEFWKAKREKRKGRREMWVLDATRAMAMRPDGHPDVYGHRPEERVEMRHDCVHWCLPGPVDVWNELWLYMLTQRRMGKRG